MSDQRADAEHRLQRSAALIEALQNPSAYLHPTESIQVLQTHISWVVLAGQYAYKIKKPVNFGFVDFSTLERRKFFCQEELRLNSRLASGLYLGVVPISGPDEAPLVGAPGQPIEWTVRMQRFAQEMLLSQRIENGLLTSSDVDSLAYQIDDFHKAVPIAAADSRFGRPQVVAEQVLATFDHLKGSEIDHDLVRRLFAWCQTELDACEEQLWARKTGGFIRECHGDMHLGNMVLIDGKIVIFDCIEFSEDLRWIDVLSEIAFCAMDLADRGRADLANRFRNACLERSGDYGGLGLFPLYSAYRALVRAKVSALRRGSVSRSEGERDDCNKQCHKYLLLAEEFTNRKPPFLAITHGVSGSGKTFGSEHVVEHAGAFRVRSDVERKRLAGLNPLESSRSGLRSELYDPAVTEHTYDRLHERATTILERGFPVIIDATFLHFAHRRHFRSLADRMRIPFIILDFVANESTCRERIRERANRGGDASEATETIFNEQLRVREPLLEEERPFTVTVDTSKAKDVKEACLEVDHRRRAAE